MVELAVEQRPATVDEVLARYEVEPTALSLIGAAATPAEAIENLADAGQLSDAVQFMARWLSKRESTWWGALCVWDALRPTLEPNREVVLESIVQWVLDPSEERRQVMGELVRKSRKSNPEAMLAMAAFCSGGSISLPGLPEAQADEDTTWNLVAQTLRLTATMLPGKRRDEAYRQFLRFGLEIIEGKSRWAEEEA